MVNKEQIGGGLIVSVGWREGKIARKTESSKFSKHLKSMKSSEPSRKQFHTVALGSQLWRLSFVLLPK